MTQAQWKLRAYLNAHGITPYKLAKALPEVRQATIYRLAAEDAPQSVSFDVLSQVITGLRRVTGEEVMPNDLIAIVEEPKWALHGDPNREALNLSEVKTFKMRGEAVEPLGLTDSAVTVAALRGRQE